MITANDVVFLSGPMTGIEDYNYPAFDEAAKALRAKGFLVLNPAEHVSSPDAPWNELIRRSLDILLRTNKMAVLPGWENSRGAVTEVTIANVLGIPIHEYPSLEPLQTQTMLSTCEGKIFQCMGMVTVLTTAK